MAKRKLPDSVHRAELTSLWRYTSRFIQNPLKPSPGQSGSAMHFLGGPNRLRGAKCAKCSQKLAVLWDIDLADPLIDDDVRRVFNPVVRLPLLMCWQCMALSYRIVMANSIGVFQDDRQLETLEEDESPLESAPVERPRSSFSLQRIPSIDEALLLLSEAVGFDDLDAPGQKRLRSFFGKSVHTPDRETFSQLGGLPRVVQGRHQEPCPNPACPAHMREHLTSFEFMKELAVVDRDLDETLAEIYFQFHFTICAICFSIGAQYRCS
jgi:hypothetical protein